MDGVGVALIGMIMSTPLKLIEGVAIIASEKLAVIITLSPFAKVEEEAFDESNTVGASESTKILKVKLSVPIYAFPLVSVPETVADISGI